MERARVVINIKEGVIEFEGPLDFVSDSLEKYGAAVNRLLGGGRSVTVAPATAASETGRNKRGRPSKKSEAKPSTCVEALRQSVAEGFFSEARTIGDVGKHLAEEGFSFTPRAVRAGLTRLVNTGRLETTGRGRGLRYQARG